MASGSGENPRTVRAMRAAHNHIDTRLKLNPRDYLDPPQKFGIDDSPRVVVPPDGDRASAEVAVQQHLLVMAWHSNPAACSGAELARRCQVSRQTASRTLLGHRWCGQVLMTALLTQAAILADTP